MGITNRFATESHVETTLDNYYLKSEADTLHAEILEYVDNEIAEKLDNKESGGNKTKPGLRVAVFGDSISTQYGLNAVEITVEPEDVGVLLSAYPTYYDIGTVIGGHEIISSDVGSKLTFTPTTDDIGKTIGNVKNYNTNIDQTWWQYVASELECEVIPVTWSGSSFCSHESNDDDLKTSHTWHESQIRKAGKRIAGTRVRLSPDVIILYRGTNDMTHTPYAELTSGYFDKVSWTYPTTDVLSEGKYGAKEAISLTIKNLRSMYPDARIVLTTLNNFKRVDYDNFPTNNGLYTIPQWNAMIRECADFFGCQVIDFDKDGITFENCYDSGYITDSSIKPTHPNQTGHTVMGKQALSDLINKVNICDIEPLKQVIVEDENEGRVLYHHIAVSLDDGELYNKGGYYTYDKIPVKPNTTYVMTNCRNTAAIDSNGKVVKLVSGNALESNNWLFVTTSDTAYIRTCVKYVDMSVKNFLIAELGTTMLHENTKLNTTTANLIADTTNTYFTYAFVPVEADAYYNIKHGRYVNFMDSDFNFISNVNANSAFITGQVKTPSNAAYLHVCFRYEDIQPKDVTIEKATTNIGYSGYAVDSDGMIKTSSSSGTNYGSFWTLDMIPVEPNTTYRITGCRNTAELDSSGTFINLVKASYLDTTDATFTTTANTAYIRTCAKHETMDVNSFVLERVSE